MVNYYDKCFIAIIVSGIRTMVNWGAHTQCRVVKESNGYNSEISTDFNSSERDGERERDTEEE